MGKKQRPYLENLDIEKYAKQPLCGVGLNSFALLRMETFILVPDGNL